MNARDRRYWRKGCLCGCTYEEECKYYEPPAQVVHVVHHHIYHQHPEPELPWPIVPGEVEES